MKIGLAMRHRKCGRVHLVHLVNRNGASSPRCMQGISSQVCTLDPEQVSCADCRLLMERDRSTTPFVLEERTT